MEDRVVEVLKEFPCYLGYNLSPCEEEVIKSFKRFEKPVVQPHMWKFLKEKIRNWCIIREYLYEARGKEALDLAILSPPANIEYAIEVKALPYNSLLDYSHEIGKDFIRLATLLKDKKLKRKGFLSLFLSYKCEDIQELENIKDSIKDISIFHYLISQLDLGAKKESLKGAVNQDWKTLAETFLHNLNRKKNPYLSAPSNSKLSNMPQEKFRELIKIITKKREEFQRALEGIKIYRIEPANIDLGDNIKIRNFLFVIEPKQPFQELDL